MTERDLLYNPPQKVLLMYQAVAGMLKEGADIRSIKVSDITTRAGIGKGTAYEYFSSKEALIVMALDYDVRNKQEMLAQIIGGKASFKEKIMRILDYMEEHFGEIQTFCVLLKIGTGAYEVPEALRREYDRTRADRKCRQTDELIDMLIAQGRREGVVRQENVYLDRMAFGAQLIVFAAYMVKRQREPEKGDLPDSDEVKRFIYEAVVKSLN